jgi:hypothetical protein
MSSELKAGDLCVVIRHAETNEIDLATGLFGKTVVLITIDDSCLRVTQRHLRPFWHTTGMDAEMSISHTCLKKIPPAPMEEEPMDEELVV